MLSRKLMFTSFNAALKKPKKLCAHVVVGEVCRQIFAECAIDISDEPYPILQTRMPMYAPISSKLIKLFNAEITWNGSILWG